MERVNQLAEEHLPVEEMILLVVGDKTLIENELIALGYNIVELDSEGQPL